MLQYTDRPCRQRLTHCASGTGLVDIARLSLGHQVLIPLDGGHPGLVLGAAAAEGRAGVLHVQHRLAVAQEQVALVVGVAALVHHKVRDALTQQVGQNLAGVFVADGQVLGVGPGIISMNYYSWVLGVGPGVISKNYYSWVLGVGPGIINKNYYSLVLGVGPGIISMNYNSWVLGVTLELSA